MRNKLALKTVLSAALLGWGAAALAPAASANAVFGYTHLAPSPRTLPAGRLVYGTELALGVTDFLQIGTNVVRDVYKFYNANARLSLVDVPGFALSPFVGFETYNYRDISDTNPDLRVTSWLPGAVAALGVTEQLAWFFYGNLNFTKTELVTSGIKTSGLIRGASLGTDFSWAYNMQFEEEGPRPGTLKGARPKKLSRGARVGNVLSAGMTYDLTYKIVGLGLSHHWPGFHLGLHYFPNADRARLLPIVSGGGTVDF